MCLPAGTQGFEAAVAVQGSQRDGEDLAEFAVEISQTTLRSFHHADGEVGQAGKTLGEEFQGFGLAQARLTGEESKAALGDARLDATKKGLHARQEVEGILRQARQEGIVRETIEGQQALVVHGRTSGSISSLGK